MSTDTKKLKFYISTEFGEILDVALALKEEGHEVVLSIPEKEYSKIGEGMLNKDDKWWKYTDGSWIFLVDGCGRGEWQDHLRSIGVPVFGGTEKADKLENDRQLGQKLFKSAGFLQPISKNFKSIDDALKFVQGHMDKRWILKQNGDAPKSINHMGKFEGNEDMIAHLEELKGKWNEHEFGQFDCDLMEVVEGLEVAVSAFFNGKDWMRNKEGKAVAYLNFEEKKQGNGGLGETTGEMGTTFIGVTEDNKLAKDIMFRPKITEVLKALNYKGVFDINCIKTKEGIVALEPTCRFGIPGTSYEFIEGLKSPLGDVLEAMAKGQIIPVEIHSGVGMVMVIVAKPFPVDSDIETSATSQGEKLWFLNNGKPSFEMTPEQRKHIHLQNFEKCDDCYCVATKNGYLLTVTGRGKTIYETREKLIQYIKDNIYISNMLYRTDIGARVEDALGMGSNELDKLKNDYERKVSEAEAKVEEEKKNADVKVKQMKNELKQALKQAIYG